MTTTTVGIATTPLPELAAKPSTELRSQEMCNEH